MEQRLKKCFKEALGMNDNEIHENLKMGENPKWDSDGHLNLIFAVESEYGIKFDIEMIPALSSVKAIEYEIQKNT